MSQKISMLRSYTCTTGLRAFLLRQTQRYCFVACKKGVYSKDEEEGITIVGSAKMAEWLLRILATRCKASSFDRIS